MTYDLVGIGFGPANISLAISLEEMGWTGSVLFLERQPEPSWQSQMLLDGSDIQHHPLRDFVTPRNPQSRYGFLNFLKSQGRLFDFLNLGIPFALRKDYAAYVAWVARQFDRWVRYSTKVVSFRLAREPRLGGGGVVEIAIDSGLVYRARAVSLAPGRSPLIPKEFARFVGDRVVHFTDYLAARERWRGQSHIRSIAVVGASQSAVEIVLDLRRALNGVHIHNIQRGFGYRLKDTSPFTEHAYFPEFVDYFYQSDADRQRFMTADLWRSNYGAADHDVIHQLYLALYEDRLDGHKPLEIHPYSKVTAVVRDGERFVLELADCNHHTRRRICVDAVILATGFRNFGAGAEQELFHPLLTDVAPAVRRRDDQSLFITRDYRLEPSDINRPIPPIFVNGVCESTHGFGDAGSFSLLAPRSWMIAESLAGALGGHRVSRVA